MLREEGKVDVTKATRGFARRGQAMHAHEAARPQGGVWKVAWWCACRKDPS